MMVLCGGAFGGGVWEIGGHWSADSVGLHNRFTFCFLSVCSKSTSLVKTQSVRRKGQLVMTFLTMLLPGVCSNCFKKKKKKKKESFFALLTWAWEGTSSVRSCRFGTKSDVCCLILLPIFHQRKMKTFGSIMMLVNFLVISEQTFANSNALSQESPGRVNSRRQDFTHVDSCIQTIGAFPESAPFERGWAYDHELFSEHTCVLPGASKKEKQCFFVSEIQYILPFRLCRKSWTLKRHYFWRNKRKTLKGKQWCFKPGDSGMYDFDKKSQFYFGSVQFSVKRKFAVSVRRKFQWRERDPDNFEQAAAHPPTLSWNLGRHLI